MVSTTATYLDSLGSTETQTGPIQGKNKLALLLHREKWDGPFNRDKELLTSLFMREIAWAGKEENPVLML